MVLVTQRMHPLGLSIQQQRKVYALRQPPPGKKKGLSWEKIAPKIKNLKGKTPTWKLCANVYARINSKKGYAAYKYDHCGRKATLTPIIVKWLVGRLLALRKKFICTSATLQRELAQKKKVKVELSTIRRALAKAGYKWLRRTKKPKYTAEVMGLRKAFATAGVRMSDLPSLDVFIAPRKSYQKNSF